MDVKFIVNAECLIQNIDHKAASNEAIAEEIKELFEGYLGIKALVKVSDVSYVNEGRNKE